MVGDIVYDFSLASGLLLVGYFLQGKIKILRQLHIPAAVVGGVVGFLFGPFLLGSISPISLKFSDAVGSLSMPLLGIVFASQFFGLKVSKDLLRKSSTTFFLNSAVMALQILLAIIIVVLFVPRNPELKIGLALMPFTGFYGGHGLPSILGAFFQEAHYIESAIAVSLGNTFATIGIIYGVVGGIIILNVAARKGLLPNIQTLSEMDSADSKSDGALMHILTDVKAINPLAFHGAIVGTIMYVSYILLHFLKKIPYLSSMVITIPVLMVGLVSSVICQKTKLERFIDRTALMNISLLALEYLIVFSVSRTVVSIFIDFGIEIIVLSIIILAVTTVIIFFLASKWYKENWVENGIGIFGLSTGVLATGFLLTKMADPEMKTSAMPQLATGNAISTTTFQNFFLVFFPMILIRYPVTAALVCLGILLCCLVLGTLFRKK